MRGSWVLQGFLAIFGLLLVFCNYRLLAICVYTLALGIGFVLEQKSIKALIEGAVYTLMVFTVAMSYAPIEKMTFQFLVLVNYMNWLALGTAVISVGCNYIKSLEREKLDRAKESRKKNSCQKGEKIINFFIKT